MTGYRPMTLADLAGRLARTADGKIRWKLVWEFLEEYRWEPGNAQLALLRDEPAPTGDERWETLLAALAEHLARGMTPPRRNGPSFACSGGHGSPRSSRFSGPRRWSGPRLPSANTGSTYRPGTWRLRDRS